MSLNMEPTKAYDPAKDEKCFYCYFVVQYPNIVWRGTSLIFMHPHCAQKLAIRLLRDCWEAQTKNVIDS
jgi:hypothetical protein